MKQRILATVICLGLVVLVVGCSGKYSDVIEVNQDYAKLMKAYVEDVAGVDNAAKAAKAINNLSDGMEKLVPEMKALSKKYPELKDPANMPEEIKKTQDEMEAIGREFGASFMKLLPYMADQEVQKAQARLSTVMSSMGE